MKPIESFRPLCVDASHLRRACVKVVGAPASASGVIMHRIRWSANHHPKGLRDLILFSANSFEETVPNGPSAGTVLSIKEERDLHVEENKTIILPTCMQIRKLKKL